MEGRIGNHGNQKESEKGREKEALTGRSQSKTSGTRKASPSFLAEKYYAGGLLGKNRIQLADLIAAAATKSEMRFSVFGHRTR